MPIYNPWRGCHKYSTGCQFCYIHKGDAKRGVDTNVIVKSENFDALVKRNKTGEYKIKGNQLVYLCFSSDFLLSDADCYRGEVWAMIKERQDLHFLFLTKRIDRFMTVIPPDWQSGYGNVTVGCTVENQEIADYRLKIFSSLPIKHKNIICQPLLTPINLSQYLENIELVVVGGESDRFARPLNYDWVLSIRAQCIEQKVAFQFRQCGSNFVKDGKLYRLPVKLLTSQARKANINYQP